jgi:hypothetical protein
MTDSPALPLTRRSTTQLFRQRTHWFSVVIPSDATGTSECDKDCSDILLNDILLNNAEQQDDAHVGIGHYCG